MCTQPGGRSPANWPPRLPTLGHCLAICPPAVGLPSRGRHGGAALPPDPQGLPCLFVPPGAPRPHPSLASPQSPLTSRHSLVLEEQNQVRLPPCSATEATVTTVGQEALPHLASPSVPLLRPLWPLCCPSDMRGRLLPQGLCTRCSCPNICMICFLISSLSPSGLC